jgi:hypothetical protein
MADPLNHEDATNRRRETEAPFWQRDGRPPDWRSCLAVIFRGIPGGMITS